MALDLIKEYLVGIGFNVDENSLNKAEESISNADKTIQNFNKNSTKGFSESNDSLETFFQLIKSSSGNLGKLFPELSKPFKEVSTELNLIKKLFNDFSNLKKQPSQDEATQPQENRTQNSNTELLDTSQNLIDSILDANNATGELATEGGSAFKLFSSGAVASLGAIVAAIAVLVVAAKGLWKFLDELAEQDIGYEKLSRQLWTTKENAKEVDMALKTLGISMQDLWLSPTLLKQFNQLRQDSAALKLPKEYTDNLKIVQGVSLEFKRFQQLVQLGFQWIGNYILKYAAGPLAEIKETLHDLNGSLIQDIKPIGKAIGSVIGILVRVLAVIMKIGLFVANTFPSIISIIKLIGKIGTAFDNLPEPVKKSLKTVASLILLISSPLLLIIGLIDDLMTYFKGGKSVIGGTLDKIANKFSWLSDKISGFGTTVKNIFTGIGNYIKKLIDEKIEYLENKFAIVKKAINFGKDVKSKWNNFWGDDEETKKKKAESMAEVIKSGAQFTKQFSQMVDRNGANTPASYTTSHNSSSSVTTANSHNQIKNENTFHVYGGNDSKSTANTIGGNLSGINTRNLQGVF